MKIYKSKSYERILTVKEGDVSFQKAHITSSEDAETYVRNLFGDDIEIYESFFVLMLNRSLNTIGWAKISQGGVIQTVVDVKIIMKYAIESLASSIILIHNHPSGNLNVSNEDKKITSTVKSACKILDIELIDHIILTKTNYVSFADEGIL